MSLRGNPVEERATLPDGREAVVRIGIADDPYVDRRDHDTVSLEVLVDGTTAAALNTLIEPEQVSEALAVAREIVARFESGELEPTAGAVEPYALERR
ncbi:MAG TPA: hypothetical protein VM290_02585 [Gaiellaceae bacterium]|nr:hypothetical protein [Gaiellaceae bacterium]